MLRLKFELKNFANNFTYEIEIKIWAWSVVPIQCLHKLQGNHVDEI